jgi:GTP-binding protein LepA
MGKLQINDAAFTFQTESSTALGFGFRCGFLGLLHMEIIQERLRREFDMDVISTYPSVIYEVTKTDGEELIVDNPSYLPESQTIEEIREPMVRIFIMLPWRLHWRCDATDHGKARRIGKHGDHR